MITTRSRVISAVDLELGAIYWAVTNRQPRVYLEEGDNRVTLEFPDDYVSRDVMADYKSGSLDIDKKKFSSCLDELECMAMEVCP